MLTRKYKIWCKGTSNNANFNKEGWYNVGDYILNKYYNVAGIFGGLLDEEFNEYFEIFEDND